MTVNRTQRSFAALMFVAFGLILGFGSASPAQAADIHVKVCINDSGGNPLVPGTTSYRIDSGSTLDFGSTFDGNCKARDFPAGTGNVTIKTTYNGTAATLNQDISTAPEFDFQTHQLTLRLETCSGDPLDGGKPRFGSGSTYTTRWFPDNPGLLTGASATGEVAGELFPGTFSFEMQYQGTADQKLNVVVPDYDTTLTWQTTNVTINYPGAVSYGGPTGDSKFFKTTSAPASMELLPGTYTFHFRDIGATPGYTKDLTLSGCSFTYPLDSTPPVITPNVSGTLGDNGWYTSDVTVSWTVEDPESTISSTTGCDSSTVTTDTTGVTFTCSATSAGGTSSKSVTINRDATAPTLSPSVSPNPVLQNVPATADPGASDGTSGIASASCDPVGTSILGPQTVGCSATDNAGNTTTGTASYLVYAFASAGGAFVIGDNSASGSVYFWGSQWGTMNALSSGPAASAFKGYAGAPSAPVCGTDWSSRSGNSTPPPAGSLPAYMAVIVTSGVTQSGSQISGDTVHIVIVKTNPGYDADPSNPGTGTVVATVC